MGYHGVAGDGLDEHELLRRFLPREQLLDAAMLVAELDLEVKNLLAVALKTEMPRLNHAGMHRPHTDLVNFLAFDAVKCVGRTVFSPAI